METLSKKLLLELDHYINEHYLEREIIKNSIQYTIPDTTLTKAPGDSEFLGKDAVSLDDLLAEIGESFQEMLFRKIDEKHLTDADVYKKAGIDRRLFSKIRNNVDYHPQKDTVIALIFALNMEIEEAKQLLEKAGYAFSDASKRDLIFRYFIEQQMYDTIKIDIALDYYGVGILGF